jgi:hypothetical protein
MDRYIDTYIDTQIVDKVDTETCMRIDIWLFMYIYLCLNCSLSSRPVPLPLQVPTAYGHQQVHAFLDITFPLCVRTAYHVWTRYRLLIESIIGFNITVKTSEMLLFIAVSSNSLEYVHLKVHLSMIEFIALHSVLSARVSSQTSK